MRTLRDGSLILSFLTPLSLSTSSSPSSGNAQKTAMARQKRQAELKKAGAGKLKERRGNPSIDSAALVVFGRCLSQPSPFLFFSGSQAKANASAQTLLCQICRSTFVCTSSRASLTDHSANKHPKNTFEQCFPGFTG